MLGVSPKLSSDLLHHASRLPHDKAVYEQGLQGACRNGKAHHGVVTRIQVQHEEQTHANVENSRPPGETLYYCGYDTLNLKKGPMRDAALTLRCSLGIWTNIK